MRGELDKEKYQHSQTEITKDKAIRDFTAYQKEMWSKESDLLAIPGYKKHVKELREEVEKQDLEIADLTEELQRIKTQLGEKENAIAKLENQLSGTVAELKDRDMAPAKLKSELKAREEDKQLSFFSTPEPTPIPTPEPTPETETETENIESPAVNSEPLTVNHEPEPITTTRTLTRGEIIKHILEKYSEAKINPQNLTDAVNGKSKKMPEYERLYGFKYVGKIKGQHRFKILN